VPQALSIIRDEHRSIGAILHGMQYLVNDIRTRKTRIDPRVFAAMLYYLDTFSERLHHPKEDRYLFAPLRRRDATADSIVSQLEYEHSEGGQALRRLEQYFIRYEEGGDREFPAFARAVDEFVRDYFEHMRKEETQIFPLAEKLFDSTDWHVIDTAFAGNFDPLAADRDTKDMQKLFSRIVNLAPPPIGVGPETR
jgi:hemerythrin-like domain-containing protein